MHICTFPACQAERNAQKGDAERRQQRERLWYGVMLAANCQNRVRTGYRGYKQGASN